MLLLYQSGVIPAAADGLGGCTRRVGAEGIPMMAAETNTTISGVYVGIQALLLCYRDENVSSPHCREWMPVFVHSRLVLVKAQPFTFRKELKREVTTRRKLQRSVRTKT